MRGVVDCMSQVGRMPPADARRLPAHDRLTVKQTAYRLGYPDPFSFS